MNSTLHQAVLSNNFPTLSPATSFEAKLLASGCALYGCRKLNHLLERLSREQMESQARFEHQCNEAVAKSQAHAEQTRQEFTKERQKLESELKVLYIDSAQFLLVDLCNQMFHLPC